MKLSLSLVLLLVFNFNIFSQKDSLAKSDSDSGIEKTEGVAVTPSSIRFSVKPGQTATKEIKITNDSKGSYKFQIGFSDFMMDALGKPKGIQVKDSKYTLSKWITVSPSFFDLKAGEVKKLTVTLEVPDSDTANIAAWTIITIDQIVDRTTQLNPKDKGVGTIEMGIKPSFGFGVYAYQNPPNVKVNTVEIQNFKYVDENGKKNLEMNVKNTGDGIGFCLSYFDLTIITTGKQEKLAVKQYTILPGFNRNFPYPIPEKLPKGKYSAVGVLDFGSKTQIETAELEFEIK